jgi:hypothetical protein
MLKPSALASLNSAPNSDSAANRGCGTGAAIGPPEAAPPSRLEEILCPDKESISERICGTGKDDM